MNCDITAIYYTANHVSEFFGENVRKILLKSIGNIPLISVSQKPMNFGENICVGNIGRSAYNIYKQILIGAKAAKTKYISLCEDDILYTPGYFTSFRPEKDIFAYNYNRWGIYTWSKPPIFSRKDRIVTSQLIAMRQSVINALEKRFDKHPDPNNFPAKYFGEIGKHDKSLGVSNNITQTFLSPEPNIMFSHEYALGFEGLGRKKRHGDIRVDSLEPWGKAEDVLKLFVKKT